MIIITYNIILFIIHHIIYTCCNTSPTFKHRLLLPHPPLSVFAPVAADGLRRARRPTLRGSDLDSHLDAAV